MAAVRGRIASMVRLRWHSMEQVGRRRDSIGILGASICKCRHFSSENAPSKEEQVEKCMNAFKNRDVSDSELKDCLSAVETAYKSQGENCGSTLNPEREAALQKCMNLLPKKDLSDEELEECLQALRTAFGGNDPRLGSFYLRLAQLYDIRGDVERVLMCCEQAMKFLHEGSMEYAMALQLLAYVDNKKGEHEICIEKLQKVAEIVNKNREFANPLKFSSEFLRADALSALGRHEEALSNYFSGVATQEKFTDKNNPRLADGYLRVAEALRQTARVQEAIDYCHKALNIHLEQKAEHSLAEAAARRLLAVLYRSTNEQGKAVEQNKIVREILMKHGRRQEARLIDIGIAVCQIGLKKYDEATQIFDEIISDFSEKGLVRGLAHINLAKICLLKGDQERATEHAEAGRMIFRKNKSSSLMVAEGFSELASLFDNMGDYELAMDLYKDAQGIYADIPGQANAVAGTLAQIGSMCYFLTRYEDAVTYLGRSAKILENSLGKEHHAYGSVLNQMGVANLEMKNLVIAADQFENAKKIYTNTYGPGHPDTLAINHNLVIAYSQLSRWDKSIKCQGEIIKELEKQNATSERLKREHELLKELELAIVTQSL